MRAHPTTAKAFAISVLAIAGLLQPAAAAGSSFKPVKIYVLSGQSNMTGRGEMGSLSKPAADQKATLVRYIMAQFAVSKRPEFKDAAVTVETRDFYRPQDPFGGNKQGIQWHANGESYWLVGKAMGRAMLSLLPAKPAKP